MKRIRYSLAFVILIWVSTVGCNFPSLAQTASPQVQPERIIASGTIEAETISLAAEVGGRIIGVNGVEGESVTAGEVLVQLDTGMLQAKRTELETAIITAQANLAHVMSGPPPEEITVAKADLAQAEAQRDSLYWVWQDALRMVDNPQPVLVAIRDLEAQITAAEGRVELAQATRREAAIREEAASRDQSSHAALVGYDIAKKQHQAAGIGLNLAEGELALLRNQLAHLWRQYNNPIELQAQAHQAHAYYGISEAVVAVAEARLAVVQAGSRAEEIAVAQAQLLQAESALALVEADLAQLTVTAPRDGIITIRIADPGELAAPGATLFRLTDLDRVTLRVFIAETEIGHVKVGQVAHVTIDSVSQPFTGTVAYIANEAEFTPKNVQTQAERVNLVFAVEIALNNPDHILKPGMPADAEILMAN